MNPQTKLVLTSGIAGASFYGVRRAGLIDSAQEARLQELRAEFFARRDGASAVAYELLRTSVLATAAGIFQVYSGGIVIDTVATRLQAGLGANAALFGLRSAAPVGAVVDRYVRRSAFAYRAVPELAARPAEVYWGLLLRSNLCAGHFVTMQSRFPYLFLNFGTYQLGARWLASRRSGGAPKTVAEELACVGAATCVSSTAITVAECPKILDQVGGRCGAPTTVSSVYRDFGLARLLRGYSACFCREGLFNFALLGSPAVAGRLRAAADGGPWAEILDGREVVVASALLGLPMGFLTNAPDQLKTRIQMGRHANLREALRWQVAHGGGVSGLFGRAAAWRALFIAHAVVTFNFARGGVERLLF